MDGGGVLACLVSSERIQSEGGASLWTLYTGQQLLGNVHSPLHQQIRQIKAPSETEMETWNHITGGEEPSRSMKIFILQMI